MIITRNNTANGNFTRVFDELFNTLPHNYGKDVRVDNSAAPVNITETAAGYNLDLLAPGRNKEDFKINVEKGLLTISFDQKPATENKDENKTVRREFTLGSFKRTFSVDEKINADAIEARYDNGILKVFLPKKEEVKVSPKQIQIQ